MFQRSVHILSRLRGDNARAAARAVAPETVPRQSGEGPFVALPQFEAIGRPATLLNVSLPASATLNIRNGAVVAMNGDMAHISTRLRTLGPTRPLLYHEVRSVLAASVLISGAGGSAFAIVDIDGADPDPWCIANSHNVIAWTGYDFELRPHLRVLAHGGGLFRLPQFTALRTHGLGRLVLGTGGSGDLFDIELGPNEELLLEPSCLVAHNAAATPAAFRTIAGANWLPRLPSVGVAAKFAASVRSAYSQVAAKARRWITPTLAVLRNWRAVLLLGRNVAAFVAGQWTRLTHKDVYYHVRGPCKVIVSGTGGGVPRRRTFAKAELESVYETLK